MKIKNSKIVLTGASSGIGLAMLTLLAREPSNEILAVSRLPDNAPFDKFKNVEYFSADMSTKDGINSMFERISVKWNGIADAYILNAGFGYYGNFNEISREGIERLYATNFFAYVDCLDRIISSANGHKTKVLFTCSGAGILAIPGFALYSSSKFALKGFSDAARYELPQNISLSLLYPVGVYTDFYREANTTIVPWPQQKSEYVAKHALTCFAMGRKNIYTSFLFVLSRVTPFAHAIYKCIYSKILKKENKKKVEIE